VAISPSGPVSSTVPSSPPTPSAQPIGRPGGDVQAGQLVTAVDGWALSNGVLQLTHDGGQSWTGTTPAAPASERVVGAAFADGLHGWVVGDEIPAEGTSGTLRVIVHRTDDGGATWDTVPLAAISSPGPDPLVGFPTFSVLSADDAWILLFVEQVHGSTSRLYATHDGGRSWQRRATLTETQSIAFLDPLNGWAIRTDTNALLRTRDGGVTWARRALPAVPGLAQTDLYLTNLPFRLADGRLMLFEVAARDGDRGVLLTSADGGTSWTVAARSPAGIAAYVAVAVDGTWILGGSSIQVSHDEGGTWAAIDAGLSGTIESMSVADGSHVSALVAVPACGANADCYVPHQLWMSDDAGLTWRNGTP
jgi:photosystem II stability/assembly factor-like uncharacterized protein